MLIGFEGLHTLAESKRISIIQTNNNWAQILKAHLAAEWRPCFPAGFPYMGYVTHPHAPPPQSSQHMSAETLRMVHQKKDSYVIICSTFSCCVEHKDILKNVCSQTVLVPIDFSCMDYKH